jgi:hypothetical protein
LSIDFDKNWGWAMGYILGNIFKKSSGHPGPGGSEPETGASF